MVAAKTLLQDSLEHDARPRGGGSRWMAPAASASAEQLLEQGDHGDEGLRGLLGVLGQRHRANSAIATGVGRGLRPDFLPLHRGRQMM